MSENKLESIEAAILNLNESLVKEKTSTNACLQNLQDQITRLSDKYWEHRDLKDNQFWLSIWWIVAVVVCTITLTIAIISFYKNDKITEMVLAGADPIEAMCALEGADRSMNDCTLLIASKNSDLKNSK